MPTLRTRIFSAAGFLIGLQVLGTGLGLASWVQVQAACRRQLVIGEDRAAVLQLGGAAREAYVHQAHTFIEGDAGHLDHLGETTLAVDNRLLAVERLGLPGGLDIRSSISDANAWFSTEVVPLARAGALDRPTARRLHDEAERRALATEAAIGRVLTTLDAAAAAEVAAVARQTALAWTAVAILTLGGIGLGAVVATGLARAVLGPVDALRTSARSFAHGEAARAPEDGDEELAELGRAFNRMVEQVNGAERRRLAGERLAALGEMSGAVAHELLNPLAVILGHPAMRSPELAPVRQEAEHARRVVQGLLGFARPGEEGPVPVDLLEAARDAVRRIGPAADHREVAVQVAGTSTTVSASPSAIRQVFDNLLQNAVQASGPCSVVEVEVRGAVVEVRDRGPGIPDTIRPRLYEPFVTGRHEGTGLGLAICQRIARASSGSLSHLDRDGGGTVAVWEVGHG